MPGRRSATGAALLAGLLLLLPGQVAGSGAAFTDVATTTTGQVGAGVFVPAAANPVGCSVSPVLATTITFTTPRVTEPPRGVVEYVLRLYRTDVTPAVQVGPDHLMTVGATQASFSFTTSGLTLLRNGLYQVRVTTRLTESSRESAPARTRDFRDAGLLVAAYICGTAG